MSELKAIVDEFRHAEQRTYTWVAEQMDISKQELSGWWTRGRSTPPKADVLRALSRVTKVKYRTVLDAALIDFGYLPEEGTGDAALAAQKSPRSGRIPTVTGEQMDRATPTPEQEPDS